MYRIQLILTLWRIFFQLCIVTYMYIIHSDRQKVLFLNDIAISCSFFFSTLLTILFLTTNFYHFLLTPEFSRELLSLIIN